MAKRNLTVQLDEATIRRAQIIAAEQGTSIGGLVAQQIEQMVSEADRYNAAREQILHHLKKPPFRLCGTHPSREELRHRKLGDMREKSGSPTISTRLLTLKRSSAAGESSAPPAPPFATLRLCVFETPPRVP